MILEEQAIEYSQEASVVRSLKILNFFFVPFYIFQIFYNKHYNFLQSEELLRGN